MRATEEKTKNGQEQHGENRWHNANEICNNTFRGGDKYMQNRLVGDRFAIFQPSVELRVRMQD